LKFEKRKSKYTPNNLKPKTQMQYPAMFKTMMEIFFLLSLSLAVQAQPLRTGLDVLLEKKCSLVAGKSVALVTNRTGVDAAGVPNYVRLAEKKIKVKKIFTPEHGLFAKEEAGKKINATVTFNGIDVISLYGKRLKPTRSELDSIDVVVFDIQDVGTRFYTYVSTMSLCMQAAAEAGKEFTVLDRPNPISPIVPQGFVLDEKFESFVGKIKTPLVHQMTVGEIATMIQAEDLPTLHLTVVKMENYSPDKFMDSARFVPPSPNLKRVDAACLYPAVALLEGTVISEGRGTATPFEVFGSPFIDAAILKSALEKEALKGVAFDTVSFVPMSIAGVAEQPKFNGERCFGVKIRLTNRDSLEPFKLGVAILVSLKKNFPNHFSWNKNLFIDQLAGTDELRRFIDAGKSTAEIVAATEAAVRAFDVRRKKYLLYK
jgi:uncharacterized protein YbbC (DUF1343 family)